MHLFKLSQGNQFLANTNIFGVNRSFWTRTPNSVQNTGVVTKNETTKRPDNLTYWHETLVLRKFNIKQVHVHVYAFVSRFLNEHLGKTFKEKTEISWSIKVKNLRHC